MSVDEAGRLTYAAPDVAQQSFRRLRQFLEDGQLCDVQLRVGGRAWRCHRLVLACCSPYFHAMFTTPLAESHQEVMRPPACSKLCIQGMNSGYNAGCGEQRPSLLLLPVATVISTEWFTYRPADQPAERLPIKAAQINNPCKTNAFSMEANVTANPRRKRSQEREREPASPCDTGAIMHYSWLCRDSAGNCYFFNAAWALCQERFKFHESKSLRAPCYYDAWYSTPKAGA